MNSSEIYFLPVIAAAVVGMAPCSSAQTETKKNSSDDSPKAALTPEHQNKADTALFEACFAGDVAAVEILLKKGANSNARNNDLSGNKSSHIKRQETLLKEVLYRPPKDRGRAGVTAKQVISITKLLLEGGADPDATNGGRATPISYACGGFFGPMKVGRPMLLISTSSSRSCFSNPALTQTGPQILEGEQSRSL